MLYSINVLFMIFYVTYVIMHVTYIISFVTSGLAADYVNGLNLRG